MQSFLARFGVEIKRLWPGLDQVRFRGTIRWLASDRGVGTYLSTQRIKQATERLAERQCRSLIDLASSQERKETRAAYPQPRATIRE